MAQPIGQLTSDNISAVCPEAWQALEEANRDQVPSYGEDPWTARAADAIRRFLGRDGEVFFVFTGTAANALSLATLAPPFGRVACTPGAHVLLDECGAPGLFGGGLQLSPLAAPHGKLDRAALDDWASSVDVHVGLPAAVTLTQASELGTVYSLDALRAIAGVARARSLRVHLDGARFANALAALGCSPAELLDAAGCDALSLGGTKNGLLGSEAVVLFDRDLARQFGFRRKQAGQLASKHRFLAAPWLGVLESGAYLRNGAHANAMAARLEAGARELGLLPVHPREANALFLDLPGAAAERLRSRGWRFYREESWGAERFVCGWDTRDDDVARLLTDFRSALAG